MTPCDLLFSNPAIEERFRAMVKKTNKEIGGYLILTSEPRTWPGLFDRRGVAGALCADIQHVYFIETVICLDNRSDQPVTTYRTLDIEAERDMAYSTAYLYGGWPIHFHSHPNNSPAPSTADLIFAARWCEEIAGKAHFAIVTPDPLRVTMHSIEYTHTGSTPSKVSRCAGQFYSWRKADLHAIARRARFAS